ncbi:YciI family protein [Spirillospora sp. NPDC048911]|uniref:YciI family protein n=1 Tax=Spirillospora sp. NPDC048911 TaxID=3364527 RepID=UPI0037158A3A
MKYMLMMYETDKDWVAAPEQELKDVMAEHIAFTRHLDERGVAWSGEALRPSTSATTVRPSTGGLAVTDGPYVELTEYLGGFYVIEARDLDHALEIARRCPMGTGIEVRPIWDVDTPEQQTRNA